MWEEIFIDDFFPCFPLGDPIFNHNSNKQIWVLLLEKAFAKIHGNYACLIMGNCKEALLNLTGCPTFEIKIEFENSVNFEIWNVIKK